MCVARPVAVVEVVVEVWTKAHLPVSGRQPVGGAGERGTYLQFSIIWMLTRVRLATDGSFREKVEEKKSGGGDSENGQVWVCSSLYSRIQSCVLFCHIGMPLLKGSERDRKKKTRLAIALLCHLGALATLIPSASGVSIRLVWATPQRRAHTHRLAKRPAPPTSPTRLVCGVARLEWQGPGHFTAGFETDPWMTSGVSFVLTRLEGQQEKKDKWV